MLSHVLTSLRVLRNKACNDAMCQSNYLGLSVSISSRCQIIIGDLELQKKYLGLLVSISSVKLN